MEPCGDIGEYVRPVARNFEDFLSLLLTCSRLFAVERACLVSKEEFYAFLRDNPPTIEAEQTMHVLERDLSVSFMEEPYDYIRHLQKEFDYSQIVYSEEYYSVVGDGVQIPENETWEVFYGKSIKEKSCPGEEVAINREFSFANRKWRIP